MRENDPENYENLVAWQLPSEASGTKRKLPMSSKADPPPGQQPPPPDPFALARPPEAATEAEGGRMLLPGGSEPPGPSEPPLAATATIPSPGPDPFALARPPEAATSPDLGSARHDHHEYFGHTKRLPARADGQLTSQFFDHIHIPSGGPDAITDDTIEQFREFGLEVEFEHPQLGTFFVVSDHTDEDRAEMTWDMLKQILTLGEIFPEMTLAGLRRRKGD